MAVDPPPTISVLLISFLLVWLTIESSNHLLFSSPLVPNLFALPATSSKPTRFAPFPSIPSRVWRWKSTRIIYGTFFFFVSRFALMARVVAHIDMDCFYVAVERSHNPSLRYCPSIGLPLYFYRGVPCVVIQYNPFEEGGVSQHGPDEVSSFSSFN